jgi:hypothetical protein
VLRTGIIMHSDHSGSTRRFRNSGRVEDLWGQQVKFAHRKEVVAISVVASMLWLVGSARGKNACMFASVVGDVVA